MLEPALQDGKKIPKWHPQARLGMFLGFSPFHSYQVPLVLNMCTGKISPQYHVIFDDKFETVKSLPADKPLDKAWLSLFKLECEYFLDEEYNESGKPFWPYSRTKQRVTSTHHDYNTSTSRGSYLHSNQIRNSHPQQDSPLKPFPASDQ